MQIKAILCCVILFLGSLQEVITARRRAPAGGGGSAPTVVQTATCNDAGGPFTCAFTSNVGVGHSVSVFVGWVTGGTITLNSVADGDSNAYSNTAWASGATACNFNGADVRVWTRFNITNNDAGTKTITATFSASPSFTTMIVMIEWSGGSAVDKTDCGHQIGTTTPTSPSITTTANDALHAVGYDSNLNTRTWTAGTNVAWTGRGGTSNSWYHETFSQTSSGAVTGNFTINTSDTVSTGIVAIKP